jgi:hypothetical protein
MKFEICVWLYDRALWMWYTACGQSVEHPRAVGSKVRFMFCPYCGKPIKEKSDESSK